MNYKRGYSQYKSLDVFCIGYPLGEEVANGSGKIINVENFEFEHDIPTEKDHQVLQLFYLIH